MIYSVFHSCRMGKTFSWIKSKIFLAQLESVLIRYGQTGSVTALCTESPVLEEVCQHHLRGAPGYITPVSLTSHLRSYFSNVQSSLWLLHSSWPSSLHWHSTSKVVSQKNSAISATKSFQKLQICSPPHLSHGLGNWKQSCHTRPCLLACFNLSSLDQTTERED